MKVAIVTPVRLFADGLAACLEGRAGMSVAAVTSDLGGLREALATAEPDLALLDVSQGFDVAEVRDLAACWPAVKLVALGLREQRQEVIACGRAGFAGYVSREASIDALCGSLSEIAAGRLPCSPEIAGSLLRALCGDGGAPPPAPDPADALTRREGEVLDLLGEGLSNKEIGSKLCLSVATVKHHVHHVLEKLGFKRRTQAMRRTGRVGWGSSRASMPTGRE